MLREVISWLGYFTGDKNGKNLLSKFKIFDYLKKLIDRNGYYDHLNQLILNSFNFSIESPSRDMMKLWSFNSSPQLSKCILEYCRMLHRNGLFDFYDFFLPLLYQYFALRDPEISAAAFNVIEEISGDEGGLTSLLKQQEHNIISDV